MFKKKKLKKRKISKSDNFEMYEKDQNYFYNYKPEFLSEVAVCHC